MTAGGPEIRPLDMAGVETALDWAAREGWNPGLDDAAPFHAADPAGFLGAFDGGELVATISAVRSGAAFGFVGLFIARPDRRGRGFGKTLWQAGIARLAGRTVGLDGVVAQQANYRAQGFAPAFRTLRYAGTARGGGRAPQVVAFERKHETALLAIDRRCFPAPREEFLRIWLAAPRRTFVHVEDGAANGFVTLRACRSGHKLGPLFAASPTAAERLLAAALAAVPGEPVAIDVPEANRDAVRIAEAAGLAPVFETMRMYRGLAPALPLGEIYGLTSLELG